MNKEENLKKSIENFIDALTSYCNLDRNDPNIKETADRVYRMYTNELLIGYKSNPKDYLKTFEGTSISNEPLIIENIPVKSVCSHHLLPFLGHATITISYKKNASVLGLSKYYRIVDHFSRKLQLQEKLTTEIADFLYNNLEVEYVKVEIEAEHTCVSVRGVNVIGNKTKSTTTINNIDK